MSEETELVQKPAIELLKNHQKVAWDKIENKIKKRISIDKHTGCWEWTGAKTPQGYAAMTNSCEFYLVHRFLYELIKHKIPDGMHIDHLCRNRCCVNPFHLEAVTPKENALRGFSPPAINARKTRCIHGHRFDEENTYITKLGHRKCRKCNAKMERERQRRINTKQLSVK